MNLGRMTTKKRAPRPILLKLLKPELKRSQRYGAGEADLCFGPLVLAEDPASISSIHMGAYSHLNPSSRGSVTLF